MDCIVAILFWTYTISGWLSNGKTKKECTLSDDAWVRWVDQNNFQLGKLATRSNYTYIQARTILVETRISQLRCKRLQKIFVLRIYLRRTFNRWHLRTRHITNSSATRKDQGQLDIKNFLSELKLLLCLVLLLPAYIFHCQAMLLSFVPEGEMSNNSKTGRISQSGYG
jgi:hypothetical protein